ncbi:MAG: hypothetical protein ACR2JI_14720 [Mycobacterium sp.]
MGDSVLYDLPGEFLADFAASDGYCDAQSILPSEDGFVCHCTCGRWDIRADSSAEGLELARRHTAQTG